MNISHLLQLCMSVTINVNHISLWALSWLPVLHVCLSFLLLFVHLLCLSLRVFLCRCCPPPFHCDSVWLFGLQLIHSVPAGLGRKTQIAITNQTPPPTLAFSTSLSVVHQFYFSCLIFKCLIQKQSRSVHARFQTLFCLFHFFFWPVAHLFLLSVSVSGPCLFCAHDCP